MAEHEIRADRYQAGDRYVERLTCINCQEMAEGEGPSREWFIRRMEFYKRHARPA